MILCQVEMVLGVVLLNQDSQDFQNCASLHKLGGNTYSRRGLDLAIAPTAAFLSQHRQGLQHCTPAQRVCQGVKGH